MASRIDPSDPHNMSPDDRVVELAAILAAGVLRLRRGLVSPELPPAATVQDSSQICLDECAETRLHGPRG